MTDMDSGARLSLDEYLNLAYPFNVIADQEIGGYVIAFPDLSGCITHVDTTDEIGAAADEIRRLWIRTQYEDGENVPLPSYPQEFSGKFNVRIPRSLHRQLVLSAEREGVSLNQYVVTILARGDAVYQLDTQLARLCEQSGALSTRI